MTTGKTTALTRQTFVGKVMSLLFNMLFRFVIAFLARSKRLLISRLNTYACVYTDRNTHTCSRLSVSTNAEPTDKMGQPYCSILCKQPEHPQILLPAWGTGASSRAKPLKYQGITRYINTYICICICIWWTCKNMVSVCIFPITCLFVTEMCF